MPILFLVQWQSQQQMKSVPVDVQARDIPSAVVTPSQPSTGDRGHSTSAHIQFY